MTNDHIRPINELDPYIVLLLLCRVQQCGPSIASLANKNAFFKRDLDQASVDLFETTQTHVEYSGRGTLSGKPHMVPPLSSNLMNSRSLLDVKVLEYKRASLH